MERDTSIVELAKAIGRIEGTINNGLREDIAEVKRLAQSTCVELRQYIEKDRKELCYFLQDKATKISKTSRAGDRWKTVAAIVAILAFAIATIPGGIMAWTVLVGR